jgi:demethylmenaquinone methyltransferase/2-methoxy-6-polyprenyl-1,4-benzoquinol methylase
MSKGADVSREASRISAMFDAIAPRYDFLNHLLSAGIDRSWRRRAIRSLHLSGRETVLDLCTGTGDLAIEARQAAPGAALVLGVDFSSVMLELGVKKLRSRRLDNAIALVRGDASTIPVADRSVDAVTIAFGIRNVADRGAACREMLRVLKPGGRLAILEFAMPASPVVRWLYLSYFRHILPRIGAWISGHDSAYAYLPASVDAFEPAEFVDLLRTSGFVDVTADPMTFASVFLYTARRASSLQARAPSPLGPV